MTLSRCNCADKVSERVAEILQLADREANAQQDTDRFRAKAEGQRHP